MEKSRLRNRHLKYPSRENFVAYKNIKSKCNYLLTQPKKKYIKDISNKEAATSKSFWNTFKLFITHKGIQRNENINIEVEVKGLHEKVDIRTKDLINDEKIVMEMFNKHYINIVEKTSRIAPKNLGNSLDLKPDKKSIREIIENYRNHPSIIKIKKLLRKNTFLTFMRPPQKI